MTNSPVAVRTGWTTILCDSLEKIFPDTTPRPADSSIPLHGIRGGRVAFQIALLPPEFVTGAIIPHPPEGLVPRIAVNVSASEGVTAHLSSLDLIPARFLAFDQHDDNYLRTDAGLWPDLLRPLERDEPVTPCVGQWQGVWIELEIGADAPIGPVEIAIDLSLDHTGDVIGRETINLEIVDIPLQPLQIINTHWLHADSICNYYGIEVFSEPFWAALDKFMAAAAELGINSLLTPVWTPSLDTAIGTQRLTTQLLGISAEGDSYSFDFTLLAHWLDLLRRNSITHVELAHLFTQWGAEATPPIYIERNGETRREFGWDVPATDPRYRRLMEQLLPALKQWLDEQWGLDKVIFHISDEPTAEMAVGYRAARDVVDDLLEGCRVVDAMSAYSLYNEGVVREPVVATNHAKPFLEAGVKPMWFYYCVGQNRDVSNRFFAMPSSRNRVIGTQLWLFDTAGFLHWGFNFYNSYLSKRSIDPFTQPDAAGAFPAGDPFLVYPGPEGQPWHSIRGKVFAEAMEDLRLMQTLESVAGRQAVRDIVDPDASLTLTSYPTDPDHYRRIRAALIEAVGKAA